MAETSNQAHGKVRCCDKRTAVEVQPTFFLLQQVKHQLCRAHISIMQQQQSIV